MLNYLKDKRVILGGGILLVIAVFSILFIFNKETEEIKLNDFEIKEEKKVAEKVANFYIDIKGAVKKTGVYLVNDGERVIDAIEKAGGLKKNANTSNINLSKRLQSEMVVVVYTDKEVKSGKKSLECDTKCDCEVIEINNCIENETKVNSTKVNINKASIEELMALSGIGESKAKAIVSYREENGDFNNIDELKNVSGIGESLFEKIKGSIIIWLV